MTTELHVPEQYQPGFDLLAHLDDAAFAKLAAVLEQARPALLPARLAEQVARTSDLERPSIDQLLVAVLSLFAVSEHLKRPTSEIGATVARSPELNLEPQEEAPRLASRLAQLLQLRTLEVSAKALAVITAHERPFHDARILTDIRPVFMANAEDRPPAAAIIHTLDVTIHRSDGTLDHVLIAMDINDIAVLKEAIARAEAKERTLQSVCQSTGMQVIDQQVEQ